MANVPTVLKTFQPFFRTVSGTQLNTLVQLLNSSIYLNSGSPTNGTSGTGHGVCPKSALLIDTTGAATYQNTGTRASPTWTLFGAVSGAAAFTTISASGAITANGGLVLGANTRFDYDSQTASLTSNAVTLTKYAAVITTEALTTAAGASQALVITKVGVVAGDLAMIQDVGGTNTRYTYQYKAVCTTDTVTVTVYNSGPTDAINGTLKFNLIINKA